ncbi:D-aminoacylase [Oxobacter pfennigii]|uniref:D-aminoacylase n=1 Tax=Oxobacter pfennigii TaxID=36849 RepID=A0A0P8WJK5_9CLOT|nr:amidohydrolase family protein [Oxobacter pfennigii]KPU42339.1 D-aminoacylase [Oxobacter pfennigii]
MHDVVIRKGYIVDGTGEKGFIGDIAIDKEKIKKIAPEIHEKGEKEINASGKVVIPGFIDPHVHEEFITLVDSTFELFLRQGVTTVVNGNCGHSIVPGPKKNIIDYYWGNGLMSTRQVEEYSKRFPEWYDFEGYSKAAESKGTSINMATLLGHGTIRWTVMGGAYDRPPTEEENKAIEEIIRRNMEQGAWGISFGLDYVPSRYAKMEELVAVTRLVGEYDGIAAAHLRHSIGIKEATDEFIEVGRKSGTKIQISHLKPTCVEAFESVAKAVEQGVRVLADTIPRSTGHCTSKSRLLQFVMALSDELFASGIEGVKAALKTKDGREMIKKDAYIFSGNKSEVFIILSQDPRLEARSVEDIARERLQDADECMLDLLGDDLNYVFWLGGPSRSDFPKSGHDEAIVSNPYICVGTDEILGDPEEPYDWYELQRRGGFPIFMNMYLQKGVAVEEIVRRNTTMIARHFGINDRGELKEGYFADIAILDLDKYSFPSPDEIDYTKPLTTAKGVDTVIVNGKLAIEGEELKRPYSGKILKKI